MIYIFITIAGSLLSGMLERLGAGQSPACPDEEAQTRCSLALQALTHYLSWVPLASYLTPHLIKVLFQYAAMPQHALVSIFSPIYTNNNFLITTII